MKGFPKIVLVGGGSVNWSPKLISDLTLTPSLQEAQYVLYDIDLLAAERMARYGEKLKAERGLNCTFIGTDNRSKAFEGADYIIITIAVGGLDAMEPDITIPDEYGIYQTVGDTVGPGGWARGLRNVPVFADMARTIESLAPNAVVLNYTNPMSTLTKTFYEVSNLTTVGLCHGLFECYEVLEQIFKLESEDDIKVKFGGVNHFFWITDLKIKGEDGHKLLRDKLNGGNLGELIREVCVDEGGFHSEKWVTGELFEYFGYLPYVGDRHTSEFFPHYLAPSEGNLEKYKLKRTFIEQRRIRKRNNTKLVERYISGEEKLPDTRSRETAADIIDAFEQGKDFIDVVNLPNTGQISNLPKGSVVETLGIVNANGFSPINAGELPEPLKNMVLPHAVNQSIIVEAALEGNLEKAYWALYNDPLCSHLDFPKIREMGKRLLEANKEYLPQFFTK